MQLLLTDRLCCPRCGPEFGLILRADSMVERRVREGVLGCPNCRDSFSVHEGFVDLRAPPRGVLPEGRAGATPPDPRSGADEAGRLIALLGVARGPGTIAMVGEAAAIAGALAADIDDVQVVGLDPDLHAWPDVAGVSRAMSAPGLPFFSRGLRGVVVDGNLGPGIIFEAGRVVAPLSRVVVTHAPESTRSVLGEAGLTVLAEEAGTVVAARS